MWRILRIEITDGWRAWWPTAAAVVLATVVCTCAALARVAVGGLDSRQAASASSYSTALLGLSLVAGFAAVTSSVDLAVASRRRRLALLGLSGLTPTQGMWLVYAQCSAVAFPAAAFGGLVGWLCSEATTPLIVRGAGVRPGSTGSAVLPILLTCGLVAATAVVAATKGARQARDVTPLEALRQVEPLSRRRSRTRIVIALIGTVILILLVVAATNAPGASMADGSNYEGLSTAELAIALGMFACVDLTVLFAATAPTWAPGILSMVSLVSRVVAPPSWRIAVGLARSHANRNTTAITLIMIATTFTGGIFTTFRTATSAFVNLGQSETATTNTTSILTLLSAPFIVALGSAALTAIVTLRDRLSELTAIQVAGATPRQSATIPILEIVIDSVVAALVSLVICLGLGALVSHAFRRLTDVSPNIAILPVLYIPLLGAILLSAAVLPSVLRNQARPKISRIPAE